MFRLINAKGSYITKLDDWPKQKDMRSVGGWKKREGVCPLLDRNSLVWLGAVRLHGNAGTRIPRYQLP